MSEPASLEHVVYPESDGQPVAETGIHVHELLTFYELLEDRYHDEPDVYVGANQFVYYEKGNPRAVFAPDNYVVFGVPNHRRRIYKLWEENGQPPSFVMEMSSKKTWREDTGTKKRLCERLGVREYFLFDPEGDYLNPTVQGFRLVNGSYVRIEAHRDGTVESEVLGLRFFGEGTMLRCRETESGKPVLRMEEARKAQRDAEKAQRDAEKAQRDAEARASKAEAELARLRRELDKS